MAFCLVVLRSRALTPYVFFAGFTLEGQTEISHPQGRYSRVFRQFIHRFTLQCEQAELQLRSTAIQARMLWLLPIAAENRKAVLMLNYTGGGMIRLFSVERIK